MDDINKKINTARRLAGLGHDGNRFRQYVGGISQRGPGGLIEANADHQGFTFFVRPLLNLSKNNVLNARKLHYLADEELESTGTMIRTILNPVSPDLKIYEQYDDPLVNIRHPDIDNSSPFIDCFTNSTISLTGWPAEVSEYFETSEGMAKEVFGMVDSRPGIRNAFDLNPEFMNVRGDVVSGILSAWCEASRHIKYGSMETWPTLQVDHEMGYASRIYRLLTNREKTKLQKIACTGYCFPYSLDEGSAFNQQQDTVFSQDNKTISAPFRCYGAMYNDPKICDWFNRTVELMNPAMRDENRSQLVKLSQSELLIFSSRAWCRISDNYDIEWYTTRELYNALMGS